MHLTSVQLSDFRSYRSASALFGPALNIVSGENGQGKTNLLEAIRLLSVGRSFRGASDAEMVRWGEKSGTIIGEVEGAAARKISLTVNPGDRKRGSLDGAPLTGLSEMVGVMRTVAVSSDEIEQQFRSQTGRRRMVDVMISQFDRSYLGELRRCRAIVAQLNAAYRLENEEEGLCEVLEHQLAETSRKLWERRESVGGFLREALAENFARLFGAGRIDIEMRTTLPVSDGTDRLEQAREALRASRQAGRRIGFVTRGAHRDRWCISLDGRDIETHASKGQVKSAYLAWKMAEGTILERETGSLPVWLVDDPFSELDEQRAHALLESLCDRGQVIMTTARNEDVRISGSGSVKLSVHDGGIDNKTGN